MKIKTIDIIAREWFDKVNGNSYFSAIVEINFNMKDSKVIEIPFQYGYGEHYLTVSFEEIKKEFGIDTKDPIWLYCQDNSITLNNNKIENCLKKDVV